MNAPLSSQLLESLKSADNTAILVEAAAVVVAPQWPIATFAARSPWQGVEDRHFDDVARWFAGYNASTLYPARRHLHEFSRLDAHSPVLRERICHWLKEHGFDPHDLLLQRFCSNALLHPESTTPDRTLWQALAARLPVPATSPAAPVQTRAARLAHAGQPEMLSILEATTQRWAKLFAARDERSWGLSGESLYAAWREQARFDRQLPASVRKQLARLPQQAEDAIRSALPQLSTPDEQLAYLQAHLLAQPGWAGMLRWLGRRQQGELSALTDYLALRLSLEAALVSGYSEPATPAPDNRSIELLLEWARHGRLQPDDWQAFSTQQARDYLRLALEFDELAQCRIGLEIREQRYRGHLQGTLTQPAADSPASLAEAQLVFCIDVRSEPLRRAIEASGPFATFGFAGFFGLPISTRELDSEHTHAACPVILAPQAEVSEHADAPARQRYRLARTQARQRLLAQQRIKHDPIASLALPELAGHWQGLQMLWHSFVPASWRQRWRKASQPAKPHTRPAVGAHGPQTAEALEQQAQWAAGALKGIGLTRDFAPLVVIAGHGSRSRNNPYAAKLDCGACGGAAGGFNARVLAALCNDEQIRLRLAALGIAIPDSTRFVAAEHQTSLDTLEWLDEAPPAGAAAAAWQRLQSALPFAYARLRAERLPQLPALDGNSPADAEEGLRRAEDWSEVRPEWGLARNAAFIIGRREWTRGHDLQGRAFLHSYRWEDDRDGSLLAAIVAGPVTVAQWINLQYYASAVAPHYQGSGSKATQTVTAGLGVMQGNGSDLLAGLPWQAVMADDQTPYHIPQRLLVVIEAPAAHVRQLLEHLPAFATKVRNQWLHLTSFDPEMGRWTDW